MIDLLRIVGLFAACGEGIFFVVVFWVFGRAGWCFCVVKRERGLTPLVR
jgi:hypothetical protein